MATGTYDAAIMADIAMNMYHSPTAVSRLAPDWEVVGTLIANDAVLTQAELMSVAETHATVKYVKNTKMQLGGPVFFGFLARHTGIIKLPAYVCVVRGTDGFAEWVDDAEFEPVHHPMVGTVEAGFWGIYQSMRFVPKGMSIGSFPVLKGIIAGVGDGTLTVIGHSLGAALATYLSFDLAIAYQHRMQVILLASPQPGNAAFCTMYDRVVNYYSLTDYELDVVPRVPFGPDYCALPQRLWISPKTAKARIKFDLACNHHALSYAAMLNYQALPSWGSCVKGPNP